MICTGSSNCSQNRAARFGCRVTTVCTASRSRCGSSGPVTVISSCTAYTSSRSPARCWRERAAPAAAGSTATRQRSGIAGCSSSICCWLSRAGAISDGVNPPPPARTCAQIPARASNHNRLSRLTCARSSAEGAHVQSACSCGPVSVSSGAGVELHGVRQRHGHRRGRAGHRQALRADPPQIIGQLGRRRAQPPQIVKPDRRVGPGQLNLGVQIAQQTVGQRVRAGREAALWRP